jgi:WD40 repeat protein
MTIHKATRVLRLAPCIACALVAFGAWGVPAYVVNGLAVDGNGASLDGWAVQVTNATVGWRQTATVGNDISGRYQVTRTVLGGRAAQAGDVIRADLFNPAQALYASIQRATTDIDIAAASMTLDFTVADPSEPPLQAALLAAWPFDEGAGDRAFDASGLGAHGDIVGNPIWTDGVFGRALRMDVGTHVRVPRGAALGLQDDDFTLAMWVKYQGDVSAPRAFIGLDDGSGATNKWLWISRGGQNAFHINDTNGVQTWLDSDFWIPVVERWTHVAVARRGNFYTHYLDGEPLGVLESTRQMPATLPETLKIGAAEGALAVQGVVDEVAMFGRALSQTEVNSVMVDGLAPLFLEPPTYPGAVDAKTFVVYGAASDANGVMPDGWEVTVENLTLGWSQEAVVGARRSGLYEVTRIDPSALPVVGSDVIRVTARRPDGAHTLQAQRALRDGEAEGGYVRMDIRMPADWVKGSRPTVSIVDISAPPLQDVTIQYQLASDTQRTLALHTAFSTDDGATWEPASVSGATENLTPENYRGSLTWHAADRFLGRLVLTRVRVTATDADQSGPSAVSDEFEVRNAPTPAAAVATLPHGVPLDAVAFAPDASVLATGGEDGIMRMWSTQSQVTLGAVEAHDRVLALGFSDDGLLLASAGADRAVKVWDARSHAPIATLLGHRSPVPSVDFSPRAPILATGSWDGSVIVWDVVSYEQMSTIENDGSPVWCVEFSADGRLLAIGGDHGTLSLWDIDNPRTPIRVDILQGHSGAVRSLAFSPNDERLVTGGWDRTVRVWTRQSRNHYEPAVIHRGHNATVWSVAAAPDGELFASGGGDGSVRVWFPAAAGQQAVLRGHGGTVKAVAFSPDGSLLASVSDDGAAILWPSPVLALNAPPTISASRSSATVAEGATVSIALSAVDPDSSVLRFSASGMPINATLNPTTGMFRFDPDYAQSGRRTVTFSVTDESGDADTISVDIRVTNVDLFHVRSGARRVAAGETLTVGLAADDSVPDGITVTATDLPDNASFDPTARLLTFAPDLTQPGQYSVTFRVTLDGRLAEEHDVTLNVDHASAFTLSPSGPQTLAEGETLVVDTPRTANAGSETKLVASRLPRNATFDGTAGILSFTPDYTQAGRFTIDVEAFQSDEAVQKTRVHVTVVEADAFSLDPSGPQLIANGGSRSIAVQLAAAARGSVTIAVDELPQNASFDAASNVVTFSPDFAQAGEYTITVVASERGQVVQQQAIVLTVVDAQVFSLDPDVAPPIAEGESITVSVTLADSALGLVNVAASNLPRNAAFDAAINELTFNPDYTQAGDYAILLEASQYGVVIQATEALIVVSNADVFSLDPVDPLTVAEGDTTAMSLVAPAAALGDVLLTALDLPRNATFDDEAHRLTFAPDYAQSGDHTVTFHARQNGEVVQSHEAHIAVSDVPVFALDPDGDVELAEGDTVSIVVSYLVDAPDLSVIAADLPANAAYDTALGRLTFTPDFLQAGEFALTFVAMQDGREAGSESISAIVADVPVFTLEPDNGPFLDEGEEASIHLVKTQGASVDVTFAVNGLPRNADYDAATGAIRFAPDFAQQGEHVVTVEAAQGGELINRESVTFTVLDVNLLAVTPPGPYQVDEGSDLSVQIEVTPVAVGSVTLSAVGLPAGAQFDSTDGAITFTPGFDQAGVYTPAIRVTEDDRTVQEETLRITVIDVNVQPSVTVAAVNGASGAITVEYVIEDFDGDPVSLYVEYRGGVSSPWQEAMTSQDVTNTTRYTGELVWQSRDDIPSTGGADVQLRITPSDADAGIAATTDAFRLVNLLGDYDEDLAVGFDDLAFFAQAWREDDAARDIGPTTGLPPDLLPALDAAIDYEDLATFIVMWNWSSENDALAAPADVVAAGSQAPVAPVIVVDRSNWRRQTVSLGMDAASGLLASRFALQYDPTLLRVEVTDTSDADGGTIVLNRHDRKSGLLDIQTAWLTEKAPSNASVSVHVESMGRTDAELRVTWDVRNRLNGSLSGQELLLLRFEPPPRNSALLQNYPNPFNPETWIPFELSEDADVVVSIYDLEGSLIRTLRLGEKTVGRYRGRDRAAYWDGANEQGESVASGVYVYEFRAGDYREAHRMVIRK